METELLKQIVAEVMKVDPKELKPETTFIEDLGADSLDVMRIVMNMEEKFNINLERDIIYNMLTIGDAMKIIKKAKK